MAQSVGQIGLDLVVNQNQFQKQMSGITNLAKKAGAALAGAFAIKKIVDFSKSCIELGSDLAEVQNVVDVTFPSMSKQVDEFAQSAASSFGLSETMAKQFTGTFGAMAKAFGFSEQQAYDMSTTLTGLAGDVASFYNISQDEAYTKLKSVFTGETESLKDLGIVMTQSALDSYAMANGFGKTTQAMSEAEKVALRYQFVQEQLTTASGDFTRTSDGWANQVRVLKLQFDSLKASIGQGLINVLTPVLKLLNQLMGKLVSLASAFKGFTELITGKKSESGSGGVGVLNAEVGAAGDGLESAAGSADNLADKTSSVGDAAKKAAKDMRALMGFDKVQKISEPIDTSDSGGGGSSGGDTGSGGISNTDFGSLAEGETVVDKLDDKFVKFFDNIKNKLEPTISSLKRLWTEGLSKLGDFAWTALKDFYEHFLVPVGNWVLGEGLPRFIDALNNGLMNIDFGKINESLSGLWDALAPFAINVGEGLLWLWENVLVPLGTWVANEVVPRFLDTLSLAIGAVNEIIEALKPLFKWFWDYVLLPIAQWTGGLFLQIWDSINEGLKKFSDWCAANPEIVQNIAIIIGAFFAAWKITSLIAGIVDFVAKFGGVIGIVKKLGGLITSVLNPWTLALAAIIAVGVLVYKNWDTIKEKAIAIWGAIKEWFDSVTKKISDFFTRLWAKIEETFKNVGNWFKQKFQSAADGIKNAFSSIGNFFSGIWDGIKRTFSNVADWFRDKFSAAWQAVRDVFSSGGRVFEGIKDGILSGLKAVINGLIEGINDVITIPFDGINWALDGIRNVSIAGFEPFSWLPSIYTPQIPYLAQGGFVKANTPRLAMIGDNRHYGEIVAPEDKMQAMVNAAVKAVAGSGGVSKAELESIINNAVMRIVAALGQMGFYLDGELLARAVQAIQDGLDMRYNPVKVI